MSRNNGHRADPQGARPREPIAVVGMACRFPGAEGIGQFWDLLRTGQSAIGQAPAQRWPRSFPGGRGPERGGFLDRIDLFDPQFFGISPREAVHMDPQQRLMLELSLEAAQDAGVTLRQLKGSASGVFFGAMWSDYSRLAGRHPISKHTLAGQNLGIISARVSYFLGLEGPCLTLDTTSSSSLVAIHLACQSLRSGESEMALAGGVNLIAAPESTVAAWKLNALNPQGQARPFDAQGRGYVRGEGGGVVVLKPLSRALEEGDLVYCLIRGGAVRHDGRSLGLTAPSADSQEKLLRAACRGAGVEPSQVGYIETHGTGTPKGDRAEAGALGRVFGKRPDPLLMGSVKANIGHLESAAGVAGFIKAALALRNGIIPPTPGFGEPPPDLPLEQLRLSVASNERQWPASAAVRTAGVSSFGIGGTNCHLVLQSLVQDPQDRPQQDGAERLETSQSALREHAAPKTGALKTAAREAQLADPAPKANRDLFLLTAHCGEALDQLALSMLDFLSSEDVSCRDVSYTLRCRRSHLRHRLAFTFASRQELLDRLAHFTQGGTAPEVRSNVAAGPESRKLVLVFPRLEAGGPQLDDHPCWEPVRSQLRLISGLAGLDEKSLLTAHPRIYSFALQTGLARLCESLNLPPDVIAAAGSGRFAAACAAGVLTLQEALGQIRSSADEGEDKLEGNLRWWTQTEPAQPARNGHDLPGVWAAGSHPPAGLESALYLELGFTDGPDSAWTPGSGPAPGLDSVHRLRRDDPWSGLLELAASAWAAGWSPELKALFPQDGDFVRLPLCPWQRSSYWLASHKADSRPEPAAQTRQRQKAAPTAPEDTPATPAAMKTNGTTGVRPPYWSIDETKRPRGPLKVYLRETVGAVLELDLEQSDLNRPLIELGLDSLMAMELETRIAEDLHLETSFQELLEGVSVDSLAARLKQDLARSRPGPAAEAQDNGHSRRETMRL
ncbi:MAG TPA: beta-ketoacyl synthase N-terminal-like domain-containing protein [Acidobacteriota bacterium]|nr:beta-ketoacyl synthase N-terminal-like domain-containing protein [Acidobacteriota bacterium]